MRIKDAQKEVALRERAIEMIVAEGFHGFSMQKLSRLAGLSAATIYIYFEHKEDLLNQLYRYTDEVFAAASLKDFDPEADFEQGLWLQWKNRLDYITKHPLYFRFSEQFRNSPLIHKTERESTFQQAMNRFFRHAVRQGQVADLPVEAFWSLAYGPFYTLIKFHMDKASMSGKTFSLSPRLLRQMFDRVIIGLKP